MLTHTYNACDFDLEDRGGKMRAFLFPTPSCLPPIIEFYDEMKSNSFTTSPPSRKSARLSGSAGSMVATNAVDRSRLGCDAVLSVPGCTSAHRCLLEVDVLHLNGKKMKIAWLQTSWPQDREGGLTQRPGAQWESDQSSRGVSLSRVL